MVYDRFQFLTTHDAYSGTHMGVDRDVQTEILRLVQSRWKFVCTDAMYAAFLLDPTKTIDAFDSNHLVEAIDATMRLAERFGHRQGVSTRDVRQVLMRFVRMKRDWTPEERERHAQDPPLDWWMIHRGFVELEYIATRVLSIPTSSASSERSWSIHTFIHSKRRNRLKAERVEKLAYVYSNDGEKSANSRVWYRCDESASSSDESDTDVLLAGRSRTMTNALIDSHADRDESTHVSTRRSLFSQADVSPASDFAQS